MPPTYTTTSVYGLRWLQGGNVISDIDAGFQALAEDVEAKMAGYIENTIGSRPSAGHAGRIFRATDTGKLYVDNGSAWLEIDSTLSPATAYAEVLTSQATVSNSAVDLTTAGPSVTLTIPTNALIAIRAKVSVDTGASGRVYLAEDGTSIGQIMEIAPSATGYPAPGSINGTSNRQVGGWLILDATASAHTYKLMYSNAGGANPATFLNRKLWARIIPV